MKDRRAAFYAHLCAWLLASSCGSIAIAGASESSSDTTSRAGSLPPLSLTAVSARNQDAQFTTPHGGHAPGEHECRVWWDNGEYDGVNGLSSQELSSNGNLIYSAVVADDFFLKFGKCYVIEAIEVEMAAAYVPQGALDVDLRIFEDCNGKPAGPAAGFDEYQPAQITDLGPVAGWPNFNRYRIRFELNRFEYGFRRLWIAPVGQGQGLYYWLTANSGTIQGSQGQYRAPQNGFPNWTDTDDITQECPTNDCWDHCTDFAFRVCGKCCWLLKDSSEYDLAGLSSIAFANNAIFGTRAVDNFEVPPGEPLELCRIEAWMATNCGEAFMEIYDNLCDSPDGNPIVLDKPDREALPGVLFDGLQVYRYSFTCPEVELAGGRNYWLSMAALGVGTPHERAIWLFRRKDAGQGCHICITQGQWRSFFLGFPEFTPVSNPQLASEPRDFAFRVYAANVPVPPPPPLQELARILSLDFLVDITDNRPSTTIRALFNTCFNPNFQPGVPFFEPPDPVYDPGVPQGVAFSEFSATQARIGASTSGGDSAAPFDIGGNPFQSAFGSYALVQAATGSPAAAGVDGQVTVNWRARKLPPFPVLPSNSSYKFNSGVRFSVSETVEVTVSPNVPAGLLLIDSQGFQVGLSISPFTLPAGEYEFVRQFAQTDGAVMLAGPANFELKSVCVDIDMQDRLVQFINQAYLSGFETVAPETAVGAESSPGRATIKRIESTRLQVGGSTSGGMDDPFQDVDDNALAGSAGSHAMLNCLLTDMPDRTRMQWRWFNDEKEFATEFDSENTTIFRLGPANPAAGEEVLILPFSFFGNVMLVYCDEQGVDIPISLFEFSGPNPSTTPVAVAAGVYKLMWQYDFGKAHFNMDVFPAPNP